MSEPCRPQTASGPLAAQSAVAAIGTGVSAPNQSPASRYTSARIASSRKSIASWYAAAIFVGGSGVRCSSAIVSVGAGSVKPCTRSESPFQVSPRPSAKLRA
jgi:hypothetical protein